MNITVERARSVLFLTSSLGRGGSERVTVNLANHLHERNWEVTLLPFIPDVDEYSVATGVDVDRGMPQSGSGISRKLRTQRYLMARIRRTSPDVVVSLGIGNDLLAVSRLFQRYPLVTSLRNDPTFLDQVPLVRRSLNRLSYGLSTYVVFQSEGARSYFGRRVRARGRIIDNPLVDGLAHNGSPFEQREHEVVTFSRLLPQKRLDLLIRAFAMFREHFPSYRLSIFGRGPERETLLRLIAELGLTDAITIEDFRVDIHDRIRNAALYVSSSDYEGVSNSMLEAMAIGLPAVCTDAAPGGTREIIERFGTGVLTPAGDAEQLSRAMIEVVGDSQRADMLIERGASLREALANDVVCNTWEQLLAKIADSRITGVK